MEFESYAHFVADVPALKTLDLSLEELDAILESDVVATVPPDLTNELDIPR